MGICLDTEQSDGSQAFEEGQDTWVQNTPRRAEPGRVTATPPAGKLPMQNDTPVQFESPKVPVIFVLGGPGSGKVTHCDSLMQEKKGITHINMTDLLQQYAIGNDMQDFGLLSSKTVTEVLMLEMKMAPAAKTYLVSGFPRNMRDVVEYSEKIQMLNGAIMISWRQKVLERQIDYGAKLGQVVLSLARMELNNFYKNVMPVADYFDQSNMLISPELVEKVVVVDISPVARRADLKTLSGLVNVLQSVTLPRRVSLSMARIQTELQLARFVKSKGLRNFLLTNLVQKMDGSYSWRINLPALQASFDDLGAFPSVADLKFDKPVLFVAGGESRFIQKADHAKIKRIFPSAEFKHVQGAGHWIHSERPQEFLTCTINGERHPSDVYKDFRAAVFKILGMQDNPPVFTNGKVANVPSDVTTELPPMQAPAPADLHPQSDRLVVEPERPRTQVISVNASNPNNYQSPVKAGWPPVLWVIGGPGSNKAVLCSQASRDTGWAHISLGKLLRAAAEPPDPRHNSETSKIKDSISAGEMVPLDIVMKFVESHMATSLTAPGVILDGFPRDMTQATEFEAKFKQKPTIILLDCSKLQLGRGRLDDSVTAFRRRLEIFRHSSLPMLKAMDTIGRLSIVDGDTDDARVQEDFKMLVREHIEYLTRQQQPQEAQSLANGYANGHVPNGHVPADTTLQDLEAEPIETISSNVGNGVAGAVANGVRHMGNGFAQPKSQIPLPNGYRRQVPQYTTIDHREDNNVRPMYNELNHMDGHI